MSEEIRMTNYMKNLNFLRNSAKFESVSKDYFETKGINSFFNLKSSYIREVMIEVLKSDYVRGSSIGETTFDIFSEMAIVKAIAAFDTREQSDKFLSFLLPLALDEIDHDTQVLFLEELQAPETAAKISWILRQSIEMVNSRAKQFIGGRLFSNLLIQKRDGDESYNTYQNLMQILKQFDIRDVELLVEIYQSITEEQKNSNAEYSLKIFEVKSDDEGNTGVFRLKNIGLINFICNLIGAMDGDFTLCGVRPLDAGNKLVEFGLMEKPYELCGTDSGSESD